MRPNDFRHRGPGHLESYFLRANDPQRPLALWLKATVFAPLEGEAVAESWFIWFDGERGSTFAHKATTPLRDARFETRPGGVEISLGDFRWTLADRGAASGQVHATPRSVPEGRRADVGEASFDLRWERPASLVARPVSLYPALLVQDGRWPKFKAVTPYPWLRLEGSVTVNGARVSVDGWLASQGHNWGQENHFSYAWGQCCFPATAEGPEAFVEAGAGRALILGGRPSPVISLLTVRRGDREWRFDRVVDLWRQEPVVSRDRFTLRMRNRAAEVRARFDATGRPIACLGYANPSGTLTHCLNSKLAEALVEVHPRGEQPFTLRSAHGSALEIIQREPDPRFTVV